LLDAEQALLFFIVYIFWVFDLIILPALTAGVSFAAKLCRPGAALAFIYES
jgi:hypothetical protein